MQVTHRERDLERLLELLLLRLPRLLLRERRRLRDLWTCPVLEMLNLSFFLLTSTRHRKAPTWSGCQSTTSAGGAGLPRAESSFHWCRSRPACPEPSSCQSRSGTQSLPRLCVPYGHRHKSLHLPDAWSPEMKANQQRGEGCRHLLRATQQWFVTPGLPWDPANYSGWIDFPQQGDTLCEPEAHTYPGQCGSGCCNRYL